MSNEKISTSALLKMVFKSTDIKRYISDCNTQFDSDLICNYLNMICIEKNTIPEKVINKAGIERTYGHQLFNGIRNPSRDKLIQLAFGFEMNYDEIQLLLKKARKALLHPKIKRDAVIIFALKQGYKIIDLQLTLKELSLPLIGKEDRYG